MSYEDYLKYYVVMGFGKIHQDFQTRVLRIEKLEATKCQVIKVEVPKNNILTYLQLYQKNPRIILNDGTYQKTVLSYLILVDSNYNYIDSMSTKDMHICVEQTLNKGTYYLLCDVNYRYCNTNGKNHGYNVTSYSSVAVNLSNVTSKVNVNNIMEKAMITFCKKNVTPTKKSNGINIYTYKTYTKQLPFMITVYENTSNNYFKTSINVSGKGDKTCCIYCDNIASEKDTKVVKQLPPQSISCVIILKYSNSSIISISTTITSSSKEEYIKSNKEEEKKNENTSNTSNENEVFKQKGEVIDEDGNLVQYILKQSNSKYTIGVENKGKSSAKLCIILEGLEILDKAYKGQKSPVFTINPKEKKIFNVQVSENYYGDVSFQFEYA
jgi:hypothetical protein